MSEENHPGGKNWTPAREKLLLLTLSAIQFMLMLDFVIVMPLEPQYTRVFGISPRQFGFMVAAYGISAGIFGLAAGFFLDRFDRKKALLWLYLGFTVGTLYCALAPNYDHLVAARFVAGGFGGVVGAVILAVVGDVIPLSRRAAAMGLVMSAFSVASIVGVPVGIYLAATYTWHIPFYVIVAGSAVVIVVAAYITPHLRGHLEHAGDEHPIARTWAVMTHPNHQMAYLFAAALACTSFMVVPYLSPFMKFNIGFTEKQLLWVYLCGGLCTFFTMNWVGKWADRAGKARVFTILSLVTAVPILLLTNLPPVPLPVAVAVSTLFMICLSGRFVPAMTMMTAVVEARYRGGFMGVCSAVQQLSIGAATLASGMIVGETADHKLTHYPINGLVAIVFAYSCIYLARFLKPAPGQETIAGPAVAETM